MKNIIAQTKEIEFFESLSSVLSKKFFVVNDKGEKEYFDEDGIKTFKFHNIEYETETETKTPVKILDSIKLFCQNPNTQMYPAEFINKWGLVHLSVYLKMFKLFEALSKVGGVDMFKQFSTNELAGTIYARERFNEILSNLDSTEIISKIEKKEVKKPSKKSSKELSDEITKLMIEMTEIKKKKEKIEKYQFEEWEDEGEIEYDDDEDEDDEDDDDDEDEDDEDEDIEIEEDPFLLLFEEFEEEVEEEQEKEFEKKEKELEKKLEVTKEQRDERIKNEYTELLKQKQDVNEKIQNFNAEIMYYVSEETKKYDDNIKKRIEKEKKRFKKEFETQILDRVIELKLQSKTQYDYEQIDKVVAERRSEYPQKLKDKIHSFTIDERLEIARKEKIEDIHKEYKVLVEENTKKIKDLEDEKKDLENKIKDKEEEVIKVKKREEKDRFKKKKELKDKKIQKREDTKKQLLDLLKQMKSSKDLISEYLENQQQNKKYGVFEFGLWTHPDFLKVKNSTHSYKDYEAWIFGATPAHFVDKFIRNRNKQKWLGVITKDRSIYRITDDGQRELVERIDLKDTSTLKFIPQNLDFENSQNWPTLFREKK